MTTEMMKTWPPRPIIYEINAWVWLNELSRRYGRSIKLGNVPPKEWDELAEWGFDGVWLMGVWERSPAGREISLSTPAIVEECRRTLPDLTSEDVSGSPYCIRRYVVDEHLGGKAGLAAARKALADRKLRLRLDFVPNHVAPDHPWVKWRYISPVIAQLPSMLIARAATVTIVTRETVLSNIINILAREVSGRTSVGLNAVAVQNARNR
jgi:Alpha amylase, catalytic domain